jgi:hypothetical protein
MALGSSSVRMNTFEPSWGDSITPSGSGVTAAFLISQSAPWSIYVGDDDDGPLSTSEEICEIAPRLSIADLVTGTVTFSDVDSCVNLIIEIQCAGP